MKRNLQFITLLVLTLTVAQLNGQAPDFINVWGKGLSLIEVVNFRGEAQPYGINLQWQSLSDCKNVCFIIEISRDGMKFDSIGKLQGEGIKTGGTNYSYSHKHPLEGINYYRLRVTESGKSIEWSQLITVEYIDSENKITVYPNPVSGKEFSFKIKTRNKVAVNLFSMTGKNVFSQEYFTVEENSPLAVKIPNILPGIYIISIVSGDIVYKEKIPVK